MTKTTKDDRERKLAEVHDQLMDAYQDIIESEGWVGYLGVLAQFPSYSARNCALILSQMPTAQRVAGIRTWNKLGRHVRRGERGLRLVVPNCRNTEVTLADGSTSVGQQLTGFSVGYCWDVSQTEGAPLNEGPAVVLPTVRAPEGALEAICSVIEEEGFTVQTGECEGANGMTNFATRMVTLAPHLEGVGKVKVAAHELGHVLLHGDARVSSDAPRRECEAESTAFLVVRSLGFECDYSAAYLAHWTKGDLSLVETTATKVKATAGFILERAGLVES